MQFNLSHSHELGLCAVAYHQELGVDVERIHAIDALDQIDQRFFSKNGYQQFCALGERPRLEAFDNCWTRKEAYIKARGDGLALPLDRFDVALVPGEPARYLSIEGNALEARRWLLETLAPAPGYVGALTLPGLNWRVKCWHWPGDD